MSQPPSLSFDREASHSQCAEREPRASAQFAVCIWSKLYHVFNLNNKRQYWCLRVGLCVLWFALRLSTAQQRSLARLNPRRQCAAGLSLERWAWGLCSAPALATKTSTRETAPACARPARATTPTCRTRCRASRQTAPWPHPYMPANVDPGSISFSLYEQSRSTITIT